MWRGRSLTAAALATLVAGCGGDGGAKTVTVMQTSPPGQTPPPAQTPPSSTSPSPPALPGGRAAVDGRYRMRVKSTDYQGQNLVARVLEGRESTWPISTVCDQQTCRLEVRRELNSGAYESLTLLEVKDRSYAAASTGTADCILGPDEASARQRVSIRASAIEDVDGRPTAQRIDAYMTIRAHCNDQFSRGVISWRGTRLP